MLTAGETTSVPLNNIASAPELTAVWGQNPLLVVLSTGLEANFLIAANASAAGVPQVETLRLPADCTDVVVSGSDLRCSLP